MSICIAHYAKTPLMRALDDVRYAKKTITQHNIQGHVGGQRKELMWLHGDGQKRREDSRQCTLSELYIGCWSIISHGRSTGLAKKRICISHSNL